MTVSENCSRAARAGWAKLTPAERSAKARRAAAGNRRTAEGLLERLREMEPEELQAVVDRWGDELRLPDYRRTVSGNRLELLTYFIFDAARRRRLIRKVCEDVGL